MNKKSLHYSYSHYTKHIKVRYFFAIGLVFLVIAVFSLRNNNLTMIKLRNQLAVADKKGVGVQQALDKLQAYVISNMNTNLNSGNDSVYPPIQLKYSYERAVKAQSKQLAQANLGLYTKAEDYCQKVIPIGTVDFLGGPRVPCIEKYVTQHGVKINPISPSLFEFDFITPVWSPDLAGITLLISLFLFLTGLIVYTINLWLRLTTK